MAVWTVAWLHGRAASDDALDALRVWGDGQEIVADGETADQLGLRRGEPQPMAHLLAGLRAVGAGQATLALPVPGDVMHLGGFSAGMAAALDAGEATVFPDIRVGLVPRMRDGSLLWSAYPLPPVITPPPVGIGEAERGLTEAVRTSAAALAALDVARDRPDAHGALRERLRSLPRSSWPPGMPGRSLHVMQRADEVAAILALAEADDPGGALSATSAFHRAEALRPLATAVRTARCAAVDEAVRVLASPGDRQP